MDPRRKPIAIIPVNEHVNKLTPNDILLCLLDQCITDLIKSHKKKKTILAAGGNEHRNPQLDNVQRMRDFGVLTP